VCSNRKEGWHDNQDFPYYANFGKARQRDRQIPSLAPHGNEAERPLPPSKDGSATAPNITPSRPTGRTETSIVHHHDCPHPQTFEALIRSPYRYSFDQLSVTEIIDQYSRASIKQEHANYVDPTRRTESPGDIRTPWPDYEGEKTNYAHHDDLFFGLKQGDDGLEIGSMNGPTRHASHASGELSQTGELKVLTASYEGQGSARRHIDSSNAEWR